MLISKQLLSVEPNPYWNYSFEVFVSVHLFLAKVFFNKTDLCGKFQNLVRLFLQQSDLGPHLESSFCSVQQTMNQKQFSFQNRTKFSLLDYINTSLLPFHLPTTCQIENNTYLSFNSIHYYNLNKAIQRLLRKNTNLLLWFILFQVNFTMLIPLNLIGINLGNYLLTTATVALLYSIKYAIFLNKAYHRQRPYYTKAIPQVSANRYHSNLHLLHSHFFVGARTFFFKFLWDS